MIYGLDGIAPEIDGSAWVADDANIIGKVRLHAKSSVWFGATLRGDNEWIDVGAGTNIQEGSLLHTDMGSPLTIGTNCTIGHGAIIHGCTIEDTVLIGMGAIVLNGAKIGAGSLIGAGALVTEGKDIPPGSLVMGSPGKVVRELPQDAQAGLMQSAVNYQQNAARFRDGLTVIR